MAAGLAGGSTDAAAALAALNELWALGLPSQHLAELGGAGGQRCGFLFRHARRLVHRARRKSAGRET